MSTRLERDSVLNALLSTLSSLLSIFWPEAKKWGRGTQKIVNWCVEAGQPEPEFEEQTGALIVRFRPSGYHPPLRVGHDLTERQREILLVLSDGQRWRVRDILDGLREPPAMRTLRDDLKLLKTVGLVESAGRSVAARWWLRTSQHS